MDSETRRRSTALILAGAVAKGAFEAGVLAVLSRHRDRYPIARVVGASSGALNAAIYAAGIRAGREVDAGSRLAHLWKERADWDQVFAWNFGDLVRRRGAGRHGHVLELMNDIVRDLLPLRQSPVELCITLTDLAGQTGKIGADPATTFEHVRKFTSDDFDTATAWDRVARTALGSAALPFLYSPVDVPDVGPCFDGGLVNNTPIKYAIEGGIDRIIVVSAHPALSPTPTSLHGLDLAAEVIDILINERLYRDLHDAASVNDKIDQLERVAAEQDLAASAVRAITEQFGWRRLEIIQIRPEVALEGNAVAGFSRPELRAAYVKAGIDRAEAVLGEPRA